MLKYLKEHGGEINYIDIQEMKKEQNSPLYTNEHAIAYFSKGKRAAKQLKQAEVKK